MLGAIISGPGAAIRKQKVSLFISRDGMGGFRGHFERTGDTLTSYARCKRIKYKAWGNAPGMPPHKESALQAQQ